MVEPILISATARNQRAMRIPKAINPRYERSLMAQVTKVRTESGSGSTSHKHISEVELSTGTRETRSTVVANIRAGVNYWTFGGGEVADVVVRGCPYCTFSSYITTLPDSTKKNNLLELPEF